MYGHFHFGQHVWKPGSDSAYMEADPHKWDDEEEVFEPTHRESEEDAPQPKKVKGGKDKWVKKNPGKYREYMREYMRNYMRKRRNRDA